MTSSIAPTVEVESPDDLLRRLAELSLRLSRVINDYSNPPYRMSWGNAKKANLEAVNEISQLWDVADKNGWDNIFTPDVISRKRLTPKGAEESLAFGNRGLCIPILRLAAKLVLNYPELVWDAQHPNPDMKFFYQGVFGFLDNNGNNELTLHAVLDRLEKLRDPNFPAARRCAHMAASQQLANYLLQSNLRFRTLELSANERSLLNSAANQNDMDCATIALLCARLDYQYASVAFVRPDDVIAAQRRAQAAENRALRLIPPNATSSDAFLNLLSVKARNSR